MKMAIRHPCIIYNAHNDSLAQFIDTSSAPLSPCELTLHFLSSTTLYSLNSSHLQTQIGRRVQRMKQRYRANDMNLLHKGLNEYLNHPST